MDRRSFLKMQAVACGALVTGAAINELAQAKEAWAQTTLADSLGPLMKRKLGSTNFNATTLGLGGQASIQKTPQDVDPVQMVVKAYELGINYFDTSNVYEKSQIHYGAAFKKLGLVPGQPNYSEEKRKNIFLTSKTLLRWAKNSEASDVRSFSDGAAGSTCIDDLKRTLTQVFGDGKGAYPKDAYIDMFMLHSVESMAELDVIYEGMDTLESNPKRIGALAALRDYRDGTNRTGLNPKKEKCIRHLGISGHSAPDVLMSAIQRDKENLLEGLLVAINPNDTLYFNMQHNVIPVAKAKGMGIIGMKMFANGAMYDRVAKWNWLPEDNVRTLGTPSLPSHLPIQYALTTPGVDIVIVGMGQISDDKKKCHIYQNLLAAQIAPQGLSVAQRKDIEAMTHKVKNGMTNYFQNPPVSLTVPRDIALEPSTDAQGKKVRITWQTAFASDAPIKEYHVWRDGVKIADVAHKPQTTLNPFVFEDNVKDKAKHEYKLVTVDEKGRRSMTESFTA